MAVTKVVVDPITRIEGHLRIEAQAEGGRITNAWAHSTQFRGIEIILQGRDPRDAWAFTQRICGVCTVVHAVASCRNRGLAVIKGYCPFMFLPKSAFFHRVHRFFMKVAGSYPL